MTHARSHLAPRFLALLALALVPALIATSARPAAQDAGSAAEGDPVVVELFTSQGCSSCPPAEAYLGDLAERPGVIALEFHVDYWDYIGWVDPFADPAFTARQHAYGRALDQRYVYTPQMVIDGQRHAVGSRRAAVEAAIDAARMRRELARERGGVPTLTFARRSDDGFTITLDGGDAATKGAYRVLLLGFDRRHETRVRAGENRGRMLANSHVVRSMSVLARWSGGALAIDAPAEAVAGDGGAVVLVQAADAGPIAAAAMVRY